MNTDVIRLSEPQLKRFSLSTLLLLLALVAVSIAWMVDSYTSRTTYYLHVFADYYRPSQDAWHPLSDAPKNIQTANTRVGSVAIHDGKRFYYNSPIDRNPELEIDGLAEFKNGKIECDVQFWLDDPNTTIEYRHTKPVEVDEMVPFVGYFHFVITKSKDPYNIEYQTSR